VYVKQDFRSLTAIGKSEGNIVERDGAVAGVSAACFTNLVAGDAFDVSAERHARPRMVATSLNFLVGCCNGFLEDVIIVFAGVIFVANKAPQDRTAKMLLPELPGFSPVSSAGVAGWEHLAQQSCFVQVRAH
jgi:hypothetical protein